MTIICSKCAGHLYLDKERRIYECRSCGVAYGISLFFGMPMEKALNAMNRRVETLDSISHVYFMAEQLTTEFNGVARDRKEVLRERTYLK